MTISTDSQAILLLCSHLGLAPNSDPAPLTLKDWNPLTKKLQAASLRPGALLGFSSSDLRLRLELDDTQTERISSLLQRSGSLAIELERMASLGIHALTRADAEYPARYRQRLKESAPSVLFYAGERLLLGQPGIAVVGSRQLDEAGQSCADFVGNTCAMSSLILYSGGARGVDTISMNAALRARGQVVGILADSLEKAVREPDVRAALGRGDLCLATPFSPNAPFSVGTAMGRNKLIYTLADYAIVVASDMEKGGTWAGASEALRARWIPIFVLDHPSMPEGNKGLLQKGALSFPHPYTEDPLKLKDWMAEQSARVLPESYQPGLF
ncbi:MAG: DNA-processing protein DprA [Anaerolineae bacterium]